MKLTSNCSICQKPLILVSETQFGNDWMHNYKCGHAFYETASRDILVPNDTRRSYESCSNAKAAFDFQKEGIDFVFKTNFNCLIADPMGLGKTIQALVAVREAKFPDGTPRFQRILILVKSSTTYQWYGETKEWLDPAMWAGFIVTGTKGFIPPGFRTYIMSMDTHARYMKTPAGAAIMKALNIDLVIVDECHSFKNPDSARSQALVAFLKDISESEIQRELPLGCSCGHTWTKQITLKVNSRGNKSKISHRDSGRCPACDAMYAHAIEYELTDKERNKGLILLSGTPIKNRAEEYFIPLNLMRPDVFTNLESFRRRWLAQDEKGKWSRIAPWKLDAFREVTKDFIIRREKSQVLSLPKFQRTFERVNIEDENFKKAYNKALDALQEKVDQLAQEGKEMSYFELQDNLMTLRRIVGLAKVPFAIDYIEEFLDSTENEKILIGIHHQGVRDNLYFALKQKGIKCCKISGEDSAERKNDVKRLFDSDPEMRVCIVNMLAGGVGLNLQAANNMLVLERQWNAADEEQFEGRIDRYGQTLPTIANYMIAAGIDTEDFFTTMVEEKRRICGESLDGWNFTQDADAVREIVYRSLNNKIK